MLRFVPIVMVLLASCASRPYVMPKPPQCDVRVLVVTGQFVWVENNREYYVNRAEAVQKLVASSGKFERRDGDQCVKSDASPIRFGFSAAEYDLEQPKYGGMASDVWRGAKEAGVEFPTPVSHATDMGVLTSPPNLYRSREELGELADIVPRRFDFDEQWLVLGSVPGAEWRKVCPEPLDAYMTEEPTREVESAPRLETERPVRVEKLPYRYTVRGELAIAKPRLPERIDPESGCRLVNQAVPVLVPIPRTQLTWSFEEFETPAR